MMFKDNKKIYSVPMARICVLADEDVLTSSTQGPDAAHDIKVPALDSWFAQQE